MKRRALFIGVDEYDDPQIRNLRFSRIDAHSLNELFADVGYDVRYLPNPTKAEVLAAVRERTSDLAAGDSFLFYFAGHGFTQGGHDLIFCRDDVFEDLRFDDAGLKFDKLRMRTESNGAAYDRVFIIDACRSDFLTGKRGAATYARDLVAVKELVKDVPKTGSLAVLRSCSPYQYALEIESRQHGLFTCALLDVMRAARREGTRLAFDELFGDTVAKTMADIAREANLTATQTPDFAKSAGCAAQVLLEGQEVQPEPTHIAVSAVPMPSRQEGAITPKPHRVRGWVVGMMLVLAVLGGVGGWLWHEKVNDERLTAERNRQIEQDKRKAEQQTAAETAKREAEKRKAEEKAAKRAESDAEKMAFRLSSEAENAHDSFECESEEVRTVFAAEIRAFETDREAGDSAKSSSKNVVATNFFAAALAKAATLKVSIKQRVDFIASRKRAKAARDRLSGNLVGYVKSEQEMDVLSQVKGYIRTVKFAEGDSVKVGDLLFEIEDDRYAAESEVAKATLALAYAKVGEAEAAVDRSERYLKCIKDSDPRGITQWEMDSAETGLAADKAALASAKAAVSLAETTLAMKFAKVYAPIPGKIGKPLMHVGDYVSPSKGALAHIVQTDLVRVSFPNTDRADQVGAKDALSMRYAEALKHLEMAAALAEKKDFLGAREKAEVAEKAFVALRADVITVTLDRAKNYRNAERWSECLAAVKEVLGWESDNAEALSLKTEAERYLKPSIIGKLPEGHDVGKFVKGARLIVNGRTCVVKDIVETGKSRFAHMWCETERRHIFLGEDSVECPFIPKTFAGLNIKITSESGVDELAALDPCEVLYCLLKTVWNKDVELASKLGCTVTLRILTPEDLKAKYLPYCSTGNVPTIGDEVLKNSIVGMWIFDQEHAAVCGKGLVGKTDETEVLYVRRIGGYWRCAVFAD